MPSKSSPSPPQPAGAPAQLVLTEIDMEEPFPDRLPARTRKHSRWPGMSHDNKKRFIMGITGFAIIIVCSIIVAVVISKAICRHVPSPSPLLPSLPTHDNKTTVTVTATMFLPSAPVRPTSIVKTSMVIATTTAPPQDAVKLDTNMQPILTPTSVPCYDDETCLGRAPHH